MRDVFFFGAMQHLPLLHIVLARSDVAAVLKPEVRAGYDVQSAAVGHLPPLIEQAGAETAGLRAKGLTEADLARLDFFMQVMGQVPETTEGGVLIYRPAVQPAAAEPMDFLNWHAAEADLLCQAAREVMAEFGRRPADDVAATYGRILVRAQCRLNAQSSRHGQSTLKGRVQIKRHERMYSHFYAFDEVEFQHETFSGGMSETIERGVFVPTDAALVLPYDPRTDRILVVEQLRVGALVRDDPSAWMMEPVGGLIDPGETPEATAMRETVEEAGIALHRLEKVAEGYSSPGAATDFHYLYIGLCDLPDVGTHVGGLAEEGEDIRSHIMPFDAIMTLAEDQRLANTPLALAVYWLAHHRARLRSC